VPGKPLSSRDILDIYTRYLAWYTSLPTALRLGENSTPSVLFMQWVTRLYIQLLAFPANSQCTSMYYHFAILLLFGPFIKLHFLGSSILPYEICVEAANTITSLLGSYCRLYSLRRTPCFVPFLAMASNAMHVIRAETAQLSASPLILQGIADLQEMAFSHRSARRGAKVLEAMRQGRRFPVSLPGNEAFTEDPEDLNWHCRTSINLFPSDVESFQPAGDSASRQPIFSPFPSQVLPLAALGEQLKMCGFVLISEGHST
jgi:hypothetical protein